MVAPDNKAWISYHNIVPFELKFIKNTWLCKILS